MRFHYTVLLVVALGCGSSPTGPNPDADPTTPDADPTAPDAHLDGDGAPIPPIDADPAIPTIDAAPACPVCPGLDIEIHTGVSGPNHGHELTVPLEDVCDGQLRTYAMQGSADHFHAITFYPEHFETLQAGDEAIVNTDGTVESSHVHVVFVQCL